MFERTRSFWRRLLGRSEGAGAAGTTTQVEEDRRVWVRYPTDLETTYCQAGGEGKRLAARVRNISLGGVNLAVDRPFDPGALLSIELPGATEHERSTALACVVHVTQADEREWHVGCTFSRELSESDLEAFGVRRVRHAPSDQRTWQRFPCNVKASCQPVVDSGAGPGPRPAQVLDLSPSGVGLLLADPFENGSLLSVELRAADDSVRRTMLACVVHVTERADGQHALGCNFIRSLSEQDLRALL
jgi:hypothetical protein